MNKHFEDTQYYLKRAGKTAKRGVLEELKPIQMRVRELTGGEEEPEPGRFEQLRAELKDLEVRAEGEARQAIREARERLPVARAR